MYLRHLHHLLSKSPMDKQENFQIQITLQSYTRWCKIWYAIVCEITSRKFRLVSLLGLDRLISECIFFFFLANNVILSFACAHSSMTLFGIKKICTYLSTGPRPSKTDKSKFPGLNFTNDGVLSQSVLKQSSFLEQFGIVVLQNEHFKWPMCVPQISKRKYWKPVDRLSRMALPVC